ncbi:TfpX/TfpZ family type IV pilin accessory protein [Glaciimonas soli]|uniref:Type IV pilin accessory protein n=1 Tax=Glaciimonas soli TaxID=2590999 RepID=A0A843YW60_9BURK|nr:TfpX/TfpZ family type IV pilin accessory protein [Glaciimonas soli]MQR01914.1 hypothetical protein [Glaciimonas soli]
MIFYSRNMKRVTASLVHLCISMLIVSCVLAVVMLIWYPRPYFEALGVGKMLLIIASVDVTIGPLITLIIYNPKKKSLKFDLTIVAILQVIAMIYGISTVFGGRPVYAVYNIDMFTLVSAVDIPAVELSKARNQSLPISGPQIVGARLPDDRKERDRILFSSVQGGPDLPQMPQHYISYRAVANDVKLKMLSFDRLMKRQPKAKAGAVQALIAEALSKKSLGIADVGFVPMRAKVQDLTVVVRRSDASIVDILQVNPWGDL